MLPSRQARRTVWVVDDSPLDGTRALNALGADYDVRLFNDGSTVLEELARAAAPDVLVLDWVMPGVSGLDVCRFIRSATGEQKSAAILLLTSHQRTEQVVEGLAAGANDYLSKPYAEQELTARVAALLRSKALLERAEHAERAFRTLLDRAPDALLAVDGNGLVTYANAEAERVLGAAASTMKGRLVSELLPGLVLSRNPDKGSIAPAAPLPDVAIGADLYAPIIRLWPAEDTNDNTTISLRNVTEIRKREARRLDFYAIVAHDLRSPLGAILTRAQIIIGGKRGEVSREVLSDVTKIKRSVKQLIELINDFLDLARLESLVVGVNRKPLDLVGLVREVLEDTQSLVESAQHHLDVVLPSEPAMVDGDEARLAQVLTNLVTNAVKFTPPSGELRVSVQLVGDSYEVRVDDNGPGMDPESAANLGQRYFRAKTTDTRAGGTGLGIMIVREILEGHGSGLRVETELGGGSSFSFRLPKAAA